MSFFCKIGLHKWEEFKVISKGSERLLNPFFDVRHRCVREGCGRVEQLLVTGAPGVGIEESWHDPGWFGEDDAA